MKPIILITIVFSLLLAIVPPVGAIDVAPRISDREIVEKLARLEEGQKAINKRLDNQQTIMLFLTTVFIGILGYLIRIERQANQRLTKVETSLETQKDEIAWLKEMINKLLPPKGIL